MGAPACPERVDARPPQPCPALGGAPGWWTGDRVHQEMDGELIFEGRTDDVVKIGGFRVGPVW